MCRQRRFFIFVRCLLFPLLLLLIALLLLLCLFARSVSQANGSTQRAHRQLRGYISLIFFVHRSFIACGSLCSLRFLRHFGARSTENYNTKDLHHFTGSRMHVGRCFSLFRSPLPSACARVGVSHCIAALRHIYL